MPYTHPMPPIRTLLVIALLLFTALVAWMWWSDWFLIDDCADIHGRWNAIDRVCEISATSARS